MDRCEQVAQEAVRKGWCIGSVHCALGIVAVRREDYSLAYCHWLKAAELNRADGYAFLGILYYYGDGCPADVGKTRQCWQKALELDSENHYALYYLGLLYKEGYGVPQDLGKAYECLYKAAELGNDDAKKEVADLKTRHTSEELFGSSHHAVP